MLRAFQRYVACCLHARKSGQFPTFSGRELVVPTFSVNLTPGFSFSHNLCFKCFNGWCELILYIYVSIYFQWYKELFKEMGFDPYNCTMKVWESIWDSNFQHGSSFGNMRVHSLTLFALLGACDLTLGSFSWPATCNPLPWLRAQG